MITASPVANLDTSATQPPVAVGGVGGSGTRLIAQLLHAIGYYTGDHHTEASDLLWFTLLFKRREILDTDDDEFNLLTRILASGLSGSAPLDDRALRCLQGLSETPRRHHPVEQLRASAESLAASAARPALARLWGWKEPNTHIVIERLWQRLPQLRYIHVVRNGVDMAYSRNQNQLRLWGPHVLGDDIAATPGRSLAYWCKVHQRMQRLLAHNSRRMYWLDYDALCRNPQVEIDKLRGFLDFDPAHVAVVLEQVRSPSRRDGINLNEFDPRDLAYVRSLGYMV